LIVNLLENLDEFLDQQANFGLIAEYYLYYFPEILKLITPIAVLLSTLFTVGNLSMNNEITAMKSGGVSLYRIMFPFILLSLGLSLGQLYFNGWIVPRANEKKYEMDAKYLNKSPTGGPIFNLFFRIAPLKNVTMNYYNSDQRSGSQITIEEYSAEYKPRLVRRIEAEKITWDPSKKQWIMLRGIKRVYQSNAVLSLPFDSEIADIKVTHEQIISMKRQVGEMTLDELKAYIDLVEKGGKDVEKQRIEYYGQFAFPFANFIVILFGVPFASVRRKGGIAVQIGTAMLVSFCYLIFTKLGQSVGYNFGIDAVVSVWLANILFFIVGLSTILRTRT
jgi:lipopolysaccharide export system permease protein